MVILSGKEVSQSVKAQVEKKCRAFIDDTHHVPHLAVVLVGNDPASATYVASKGKACEEVGFDHTDYRLAEDTRQEAILELIHTLNNSKNIHGILVQLPLPKHIDEQNVINAISPAKDVDGLHPENMGNLLMGSSHAIPCTPYGVVQILDYYHIETSGKHVVIVGRSNIVGKPMAALLMQKGRDATVTLCHSKTPNLERFTKDADILIAAIGKPHFITSSMVKPGSTVIDVGINRIVDPTKKRGYRLVGDVDYEQVSQVCYAITPVPGGVGPMTIAMLMYNTLHAAQEQVRG